jgi:hypothetical protein
VSEPATIPTGERLAALRRGREAELILQFCDGKILGEVEMAEVSHILPPEVLANPPEPELRRTADEYAAELGTSRRTVFRWLELGRKNKDHCPLGDPALMLGWWSRNMQHKVPAYLSEWVSRTRSTVPGAVAPSAGKIPSGAGAAEAKGKTPPADRAAIDIESLAGHGLERAVHMLRQNVEACARLLAAAYNSANDQNLAHLQSRYDDSVEQLRKTEQSLIALQKARGDLAPRSEFRSDLVNLLLGVRGMMRRSADNLCAAFAHDLSPELLGKLRAALTAESQRYEKQFRTARFWQETPDGKVEIPAA